MIMLFFSIITIFVLLLSNTIYGGVANVYVFLTGILTGGTAGLIGFKKAEDELDDIIQAFLIALIITCVIAFVHLFNYNIALFLAGSLLALFVESLFWKKRRGGA